MAVTLQEIQQLENFLAQDDFSVALPALEALREEAEAAIDQECVTTQDTQYFSFSDAFERLAYRRVENDPRELVQVDAPYDRLYADLGYAYIRTGDLEAARDALKQAVRWNPMNCAYRLNLADVFRALGNTREWAALSHSVLDRASDSSAAAMAYANLGQFFLDGGEVVAAAGCAQRALELGPGEQRTQHLMGRLSGEHPEWADIAADDATAELERQGVPTAPSAEIAVCLVMCATDAAAAGDAAEATRLTIRARDLVGADAAKALVKLVRESDAELAAERAAAGAEGAGHAE